MITTLSYTKLGWADFKTKVGSCGSDAPKVEYSKLFYLTPLVACLHCSEKHYFIDIAKTNFHTNFSLWVRCKLILKLKGVKNFKFKFF